MLLVPHVSHQGGRSLARVSAHHLATAEKLLPLTAGMKRRYCVQVSKLPADVRDGKTAPQDMEQEALKRSPGWQLFHKWTFRLELAQQVRSQLSKHGGL